MASVLEWTGILLMGLTCNGARFDFALGAGAERTAGQLVSDRAVPARQGDQIAAAINGHQPGGPATAQ
jgi:hypothetical protein